MAKNKKNGKKLHFAPGAKVNAQDGLLGTIEKVVLDSKTNEPAFLLVKNNEDNQQLTLPVSTIKSNPNLDEIELNISREEALLKYEGVSFNNTTYYEDKNELYIPLSEEQLKIEKREVHTGEFLIHRSVEEFEKAVQVPLTGEDIVVERIPMNRPVEGPIAPYFEGDYMIVPIVEEVLVVQKRLVMTEQIKISKRKISQNQEVKATLRRERVDFEKVMTNNDAEMNVANESI